MDRRTDYKTALLIDAAIQAPAGGSPARTMADMGVPFDVARRVLMRPDQRRHPAPPPEFKREA
jgi:hypothetical protein